MTTSDFIDDQATVNARIAQPETRLGMTKSVPLDDIARANTVLRGLELMPTPPKAAAPTPLAPTTAAVPAITGTQRTTRAFAARQPSSRLNQATSGDGELQGVSRLAAYYARHALPTSKP